MRREEGQSFSSRVKEELVRLPLGKTCCMLSEIAAFTQTSGHLGFRGRGGFSVSYRLDNAGAARRLFILLKRRLNVSPTLHFVQTPQLGGRRTCVLTLSGDDASALLSALHMIETDEEGQTHFRRTVPRHPLTRLCCRKAFFRGAFLGAGTVSNPEKSYHFEWKAEDDQLTSALKKLLEKAELPYHAYVRKGQTVVYLKGAQQISDILAVMGAARSVLALENIRAGKQLRASVSRAANCDEHNGDKALNASLAQMEAIRRISLKVGLFTLPPALQQIARLRLERPELTLQELGEQLDPPVGKSGVNHRMRRLMEISAGLDADESQKEAPDT